MEADGLGAFVTCDINVYLEGGGALEQKGVFEAFSCSLDHVFGVQNIHNTKKLPLVVQDKENMRKMCSRAPPSFVYLGRH